MIKCLIVGAGGAVGAIARYLIGLMPLDPRNGFPVKTFLINVIGCFIIGLIAAFSERNGLKPDLVLFIKVGICGGFTTFFSFALETEGLIGRGKAGIAAKHMLVSVGSGVPLELEAERIVTGI